MLGERRLRTQRELADRLRGLDEQGACQATTDLLVTGEDDGDAVAAQVHLVGRRGMRRAAASGPDAGGAPAALEAVLGGAVAELPARELLADPPVAASETALALPMPAGGRVLGALVVTPSRHLAADEGLRGHLRDAAERLARTIADVREQEEARRRDGLERAVAARQRHVATVLQRAILPDRLPEVPGLQLAAGYRPGDAALEVGGDWYDAFEPRPGRLALAVGDLMGRGVEAAASMAQLRNGLRAYLAEHDGPGAALDHLRGLADGLGIDFCTVACVEVDLAAARVRTALAGHPPPLLITADGGVAWLDGVRSAPIGSGPAPPTPEVTTPLPPGATALLYTDGLVERRDRSLEDGLAALADAAIAGRGAGAGELVSALLDGLAGADDDTALVAVRRDG